MIGKQSQTLHLYTELEFDPDELVERSEPQPLPLYNHIQDTF